MDVSSIFAISMLSLKSHLTESFLALKRESDNLESDDPCLCKSELRSSSGVLSDNLEPRGLIGEVDGSLGRAPMEFIASTPRSGGRTVGDFRATGDRSASDCRTIG